MPQAIKKVAKKAAKSAYRFEAVKLDPLFAVLEAVAWLDSPTTKSVAEFADVDPRTAGKLLKNARLIEIVQCPSDSTYILAQPYPFKGSPEEKKRVVREAMLRLPLIRSIREFLSLGNPLETSMRKAAIVMGEVQYDKSAIAPLVAWANSIGEVFDLTIRVESLVDTAVIKKQERHAEQKDDRIAFISHSSKDKPFVRKLAADLVAAGVRVWVDEQQILVGDSIPEKVAQGLAESDFFLLVVSRNSVDSPWVKRELNSALIHEIERRNVTILPLRIDDSDMPESVVDKLYADFRKPYEDEIQKLLTSIRSRKVTANGRS